MLTVLGAISGYNSAFITSPFSIVIVTMGFWAILKTSFRFSETVMRGGGKKAFDRHLTFIVSESREEVKKKMT